MPSSTSCFWDPFREATSASLLLREKPLTHHVAGEMGAGGMSWAGRSVARPKGAGPLRFTHWDQTPDGTLVSFSLPTPVKALELFLFCCSSVCADIHCAGSEWLWWDVHDLHIAHGKQRVTI